MVKPSQKRNFLGQFKTLALLAVVFVSLGGWLLPAYYTTEYRLGDSIRSFPVVVVKASGMADAALLTDIASLGEHAVLQTEAVDFVSQHNEQDHIYFRPITENGQTHYELKAISTLQTLTAEYRIVNGAAQPLSVRITGLVVWTQAFFVTLALAVLILIIQVVLGFFRSATLSPQAKKKTRRHTDKKDESVQNPFNGLAVRHPDRRLRARRRERINAAGRQTADELSRHQAA